MRGAALADLHLGYRSFPDVREGRNTRELDVEAAYFHAIEAIIKNQPDLISMAGDVFHHPRVSDYAKAAFLSGIRALLRDTKAIIIILVGNHDVGRSRDVLTPVALAEGWDDRVHIVTTPKRIRFGGVSAACFPYVAMGDGKAYKLTPDPEADVNVLLVHAAVKGDAQGDKLPYFYGAEDQALDVGKLVSDWDVIACGDYHEFTRLHPTKLAFYSGSLERTSNNIWAEKEPKGVVFYDTELGTMELEPVPNRDMVDYDLAGFMQEGGFLASNAKSLNWALTCLLVDDPHPCGDAIQNAIVRLKVDDFPKAEREHIDWAAVRKLKSLCCHFYLDVRYAKAEAFDLGDKRENESRSLAEELVVFMKDDEPPVRDLAISFLELQAEVEDVEEEAST